LTPDRLVANRPFRAEFDGLAVVSLAERLPVTISDRTRAR